MSNYVAYGFGKSAYSDTGYGRMRIRKPGTISNQRKPSERGMCTYKPPKRTNYDFKLELEKALASY